MMKSDKITNNQDNEIWGTEKIVDELHFHLEKQEKYEQQTRNLMYRIPLAKPSPEFIIFISDLEDNNKLIKELDELSDEFLDYVVRKAVGRIFCNINARYYIESVKQCLRWRFEK